MPFHFCLFLCCYFWDSALVNCLHFWLISLREYDQLQKSLSTTVDNYFHKTTDHHSHNIIGEKLNVPINKTSTNGLQSITSSSIRDSNNLNIKTNIDLGSPDLTRTKLIRGIRQH